MAIKEAAKRRIYLVEAKSGNLLKNAKKKKKKRKKKKDLAIPSMNGAEAKNTLQATK